MAIGEIGKIDFPNRFLNRGITGQVFKRSGGSRRPTTSSFETETSANSPGTAATSGGAGESWSSVNNIKASDDNDSSAELGATSDSEFLEATNFNFTIPENSTILGIIVKVEREAEFGSSIKDQTVNIIKGGSNGSENKSRETEDGFWPITDTIITYGDSTDLWSEAWTTEDINASNFGVAFKAQNTTGIGNREARVDHITIKIHYRINTIT